MFTENESTPLVAKASAQDNGEDAPRPNKFSLSHSMSALSDAVGQHLGRIGMLGSMSIAVNSLTGPAMLNLPDLYQRAGLIPTTATVVFVCVLSALGCLHMANTISKVRGNSDFKMEVEYSETFQKFWGHRSFVVTQVLFFSCITCLNVSSVVDTAQVIDTFLGHWSPAGSAAINFYYNDKGKWDIDWKQWDYSLCDEQMLLDGECLPFLQTSGIVFTAGYALTLLIFMPMALMDLKVRTKKDVASLMHSENISSNLDVYDIRKTPIGRSVDSLYFWLRLWYLSSYFYRKEFISII
jgi:Tryptophan/tyrosine permease family